MLLRGIFAVLCCIAIGGATVTELYDNTFVNDAWNRYHEIARASVESRLVSAGYNLEFHTYPNVSDNDAAYEIMKSEAANGTDLFIIHNTRFIQACGNISRDYPHMKFITTPSVGKYGNYTYRGYGYLAEATWLAGITCGLMTKTGNVGIISLPFMRGSVSYNNAFLLGVKHANPRVNVYITQIDAVTGALQERKAAELLVKEYGVDCGLGGTLLNAYRMWDELGVYSVGVLGYDRFVGTDKTLFTAYYDFTSHYYDAILGYANGTFPAGQEVWGHLGDVIRLTSFSPLIPAEIKRRIDEEYARVVNGSEQIFCGSRVSPVLPGGMCLNATQIRTMPQWYPAYINPRNVTYNDSIEYLVIEHIHPYAFVLDVVAGLSILVCALMAAIVVKHRDSERVRRRAPVFLLIIIFGCAMMLASIPTFFGTPTVATCQLRPWLFILGYSLAVGALVAKNIRIWRLFKNKSLDVIAITNIELLIYGIAPLTTVTGVLLIIWSTVTPYIPVVGRMQQGIEVYQFNIRCLSTSSVPAILELIVCIAILALGWFVAYQVKDIGKRYADLDESKTMGYALSITFIFAMVMLCVQFINAYTPLIEVVIFTIVTAITPVIILTLMIGPILLMLKNGTIDEKSGKSGTTSSGTHGLSTRNSAK